MNSSYIHQLIDDPTDEYMCWELVPRVPCAAGYSQNKFGYDPVPSSSKRQGNQVPRTRYGHTSLGLRKGNTNLKELNLGVTCTSPFISP
jgi:hypothetical protein